MKEFVETEGEGKFVHQSPLVVCFFIRFSFICLFLHSFVHSNVVFLQSSVVTSNICLFVHSVISLFIHLSTVYLFVHSLSYQPALYLA